MTDQNRSSDINISRISVDGIGGLGLVAGAAMVAHFRHCGGWRSPGWSEVPQSACF